MLAQDVLRHCAASEHGASKQRLGRFKSLPSGFINELLVDDDPEGDPRLRKQARPEHLVDSCPEAPSFFNCTNLEPRGIPN